MKRKVYILATCRKAELIRGTTLVFDTLRVGFPTSEVMVCVNPCDLELRNEIHAACARAGVTNIWNLPRYVVHHEWISNVIQAADGPSVICDTDMIFLEKCEDWEFTEPLAGGFSGGFFDMFTNRLTQERLHTSLLFFEPKALRQAMREYEAITPDHPFKTQTNLIYPFYYSERQDDMVRHLFHDSCGLLYHAVGGQKFTKEQLACYKHVHAATYLDLVEPVYPTLRTKFEKATRYECSVAI